MRKIFLFIFMAFLSPVLAKQHNSRNSLVLNIKNETGISIHNITLTSEKENKILYTIHNYNCADSKWCKAYVDNLNYKGNIVVKMFDATHNLISAYTLFPVVDNFNQTKSATVWADDTSLGTYLFKHVAQGKDIKSSLRELNQLSKFMAYDEPKNATNLFRDFGNYYKFKRAQSHVAAFNNNEFYQEIRQNLDHAETIDENAKIAISAHSELHNAIAAYNRNLSANAPNVALKFSDVTKIIGAPGGLILSLTNMGLEIVNAIERQALLEDIQKKIGEMVQKLNAIGLQLDALAAMMDAGFRNTQKILLDQTLVSFNSEYNKANEFSDVYLNILRGDEYYELPSFKSLVEYADTYPHEEILNPNTPKDPHKTVRELLDSVPKQWANIQNLVFVPANGDISGINVSVIFNAIKNNLSYLCTRFDQSFLGDVILQRLNCNAVAIVTYNRALQIINLNLMRMVDEVTVIGKMIGADKDLARRFANPLPGVEGGRWSTAPAWLEKFNEAYALKLTENFLDGSLYFGADGMQALGFIEPNPTKTDQWILKGNPGIRCDDPMVDSGVPGLQSWYSSKKLAETSCQSGKSNSEHKPIYLLSFSALNEANTLVNRWGGSLSLPPEGWKFKWPSRGIHKEVPIVPLFPAVEVEADINSDWGNTAYKFSLILGSESDGLPGNIVWTTRQDWMRLNIPFTDVVGGVWPRRLVWSSQKNQTYTYFTDFWRDSNTLYADSPNKLKSEIYPYSTYCGTSSNKDECRSQHNVQSLWATGQVDFLTTEPVLFGYDRYGVQHLFYILIEPEFTNLHYLNFFQHTQWADFRERLTIGCLDESVCKVSGGDLDYNVAKNTPMKISFTDGVSLELSTKPGCLNENRGGCKPNEAFLKDVTPPRLNDH